MIAKQRLADTEICEAEEYLGLLRARKAAIDLRVGEADEQIGVIRKVLDVHGIVESHLPEEEDQSPPSDSHSLPPSSSSIYDGHNTMAFSDKEPSSGKPTGFTEQSIPSKRQLIINELMGSRVVEGGGHMSD